MQRFEQLCKSKDDAIVQLQEQIKLLQLGEAKQGQAVPGEALHSTGAAGSVIDPRAIATSPSTGVITEKPLQVHFGNQGGDGEQRGQEENDQQEEEEPPPPPAPYKDDDDDDDDDDKRGRSARAKRQER